MADDAPNRYREALGEALPMERFRAEATANVLRTVQDALNQHAWDSTAAQQFATACAEQQRRAADAADAAYQELADRYAREPSRVPELDRRARFQG